MRFPRSEHKLSDPLAITYSSFHDAYYLLDHQSAKVRLFRIAPGDRLELMAEWAWSGTKTSFGLAVSERGHIVVSAWSSTAHGVAVLAPEPDGLQLFQLYTGSGSLSAPAFGGLDGVFLSTLSGTIPQPIQRLPDAWFADRLDVDTASQIF